ncbi:MAG: hypothetical protein Q8K74_10555 [Candidatus Nitrotoga sp.]|nr:hypothetical protein [Candidatus Nitrotoga sp.]MDO9448190.1 hypothetical protein [Candidatus Nitrotoga sp.]MDP1638113.1 hypothetical protein [Candidatus Nitrotoga sp.]MDP1856465.1 hypothetical protein [Candidatus Nitrotoga sp.]MDP3498043.1 hypothetical protein [Candidatus Nitrotoga sp.]
MGTLRQKWVDLESWLSPALPHQAAAFSFPLRTVGGLPNAAICPQHWAVNLREYADPATPEIDGCHFHYFNTHPAAFF